MSYLAYSILYRFLFIVIFILGNLVYCVQGMYRLLCSYIQFFFLVPVLTSQSSLILVTLLPYPFHNLASVDLGSYLYIPSLQSHFYPCSSISLVIPYHLDYGDSYFEHLYNLLLSATSRIFTVLFLLFTAPRPHNTLKIPLVGTLCTPLSLSLLFPLHIQEASVRTGGLAGGRAGGRAGSGRVEIACQTLTCRQSPEMIIIIPPLLIAAAVLVGG